MDSFEFMQGIYFDTYEQIKEELDKKRKDMLEVNKEVINQHRGVYKLEELFSVPDGRFDVLYQGVLFECFFKKKDSPYLFTFLNGGNSGNNPCFYRWSYYKFLDGNYLNIADPMYRIHKDLILGWNYGNANVSFRKLIAEIVAHLARLLMIQNENIIFSSSSGGGSAVLDCANYIRGSKTISINPQIVLSEWPYVEEFERITKVNLKEDSTYNRNDGVSLLIDNNDNYHLLVMNIRDERDAKQIECVAKGLGSRLKYGMNVFDRCAIWLYDAECTPYRSPHICQEFYCIYMLFEYFIKNTKRFNGEKLDSSVRWINEVINYRWKLEKELKEKMPNLRMLVQCRENGREKMLFGAGELFEVLNKELLQVGKDNVYEISCLLDNNRNKRGETLFNLKIKHPSDIVDWSMVFVIVSSEIYCEEICNQLRKMGLKYGTDYILWKDLYSS